MIVAVSALLPSQQPIQGEADPVDQQADDDPRVDPPLLGATHPP